MPRLKIAILDSKHQSYDEEKAVFAGLEHKLILCRSNDPAEFLPQIRDVDGLCVNLARLDEKVISELRHCKVIARYGVGYDNVDTDAASRAGIWVSNCRHYCDEEVSDHAMGLLLGCVRAVARRDRLLRQDIWSPSEADRIFRIQGKIVGVVGFGGSGQPFVRKILGFQPKEVLVADPTEPSESITAAHARKVSLDELLHHSDIISLHLPLKKETRHLFNKKIFGGMKTGVVLINTSRGAIIHQADLIEALRDGTIGAAGLDVFEEEPLSTPNPFKGLENVVLTDHLGWYSRESFSELKTLVAKNVVAVLSGGKPLSPVNLPELPVKA